jgi:HK97 gp10 family phage protein
MPKSSGSLEISLEFPDLADLREQFKKLPQNLAAKHLGAALRKAMAPGKTALRKNTPKGPTGNLRKSIAVKIKTFTKDGNAVGIVGYSWGRNSPDAKGNHQGFLEYGTKERHTKKGRFASTLNSKTWGRMGVFQIFTPARGKFAKQLRTKPYPKSFFKTAKEGQKVNLGKMPIGGRTGVPPVKTSFSQALPAMKSLLKEQLAVSLESGLKELKDRVARGLIK